MNYIEKMKVKYSILKFKETNKEIYETMTDIYSLCGKTWDGYWLKR